MQINLPLPAVPQAILNKIGDGGLNLKLNQLVEAKVLDTRIMLDTLTVKINDKTVNLRPNSAIELLPGQALKLQVVKLLPAPEFKIIAELLPGTAAQTAPQKAELPLLKLVNPPIAANPPANTGLNQLPPDQALRAVVIGFSGDKLTLQLPAAAEKAPLQLSLNAQQLIMLKPDGGEADPRTDPAGLKAGTPVSLRILNGGDNPMVALTAINASAAGEEVITNALKHLLPLQSSPTPLLNQLRHIMPQLRADASVSETLKQLAQEILLRIPGKTLLSDPEQLKHSVDQSGLFLESKLLQLLSGKADHLPRDDFKLKLSELIQLLSRELNGQAVDKPRDNLELLRDSLQKAHGALAKLTLDQLNSLPRDESSKQVWMLELPFFDEQQAQSVKIEIEQDKTGDAENSPKNWLVNITVTPPGLSTIHCTVSCYDGTVNTRFWSEAADTVLRINRHMDYLKLQFEKNGLSAGFMEAHQGQPAGSGGIKNPPVNLLNEKA
ncbi:flagellar hook-length control protein FliK [Methylomonas sp. SURF-2]|uniref:Flagellar hook-length control protein FliK n=1 Tax=Methylomonas subterranea TaxID=2952225 RepID=A0ABT1TLI1_9GAMM|nr:flagellar hook-length control protein FliK [Methylomonas sp. SURF-2]MCQ8106326.1 flagellar hook-length control protein FliK [Methylomonas sp. SURF-2]